MHPVVKQINETCCVQWEYRSPKPVAIFFDGATYLELAEHYMGQGTPMFMTKPCAGPSTLSAIVNQTTGDMMPVEKFGDDNYRVIIPAYPLKV